MSLILAPNRLMGDFGGVSQSNGVIQSSLDSIVAMVTKIVKNNRTQNYLYISQILALSKWFSGRPI